MARETFFPFMGDACQKELQHPLVHLQLHAVNSLDECRQKQGYETRSQTMLQLLKRLVRCGCPSCDFKAAMPLLASRPRAALMQLLQRQVSRSEAKHMLGS